MKGFLMLAEHATMSVNGMFNALNAGFRHVHVPLAHPPNELYPYSCAMVLGFFAEGGEDAARFPFRIDLEHVEYDPVPVFNGVVQMPAVGSAYMVLPGSLYLRYPTSYTIRLSLQRGAEWNSLTELSLSVARADVQQIVRRPPAAPTMLPFGSQSLPDPPPVFPPAPPAAAAPPAVDDLEGIDLDSLRDDIAGDDDDLAGSADAD